MYRKWSHERLMALRKLAELSTRYRPNGNPIPRLKWEEGMEKLKTQDFEAWKLLQGMTLSNIKWSWSKYQNVTYGYCCTSTCKSKIKKGEFYCKTCTEKRSLQKAATYINHIYTRTFISNNDDLVSKSLDKIPASELRKIVNENVGYFRVAARKKILGDTYKNEATDRIKEKEAEGKE